MTKRGAVTMVVPATNIEPDVRSDSRHAHSLKWFTITLSREERVQRLAGNQSYKCEHMPMNANSTLAPFARVKWAPLSV